MRLWNAARLRLCRTAAAGALSAVQRVARLGRLGVQQQGTDFVGHVSPPIVRALPAGHSLVVSGDLSGDRWA
jgi:hypothetical protein